MTKKKGSGCLLIIAACVAAVVLSLLIFMLMDRLQEGLLLGDDWIFFESQPFAEYILAYGVTLMMGILLLSVVYSFTGMGFAEGYNIAVRFLFKHRIATIVITVILLLVGFIEISAVSEDHVTRYSLIHPRGVIYEFSQIDSVDTGFNRKGYFYYTINVDGHSLKFSAPSTNTDKYPEYEASDYKEFADIDAELMKLGIPKNADTKSISKASYDESCMENFRKVVRD